VRIAHLVIGGGQAGGQLVARRFALAARERGDDVRFVGPEDGPFMARVRRDGFETTLVDVGRSHRLDGVVRLARNLRTTGTDLLHTHTLAAANGLSRCAARLVGVPVVSHLHIENHFRPATKPVLRALDNGTARLSARLVAVSDATRVAYERQGYPSGRIEVLHNGVDPAFGRPPAGLRDELGVGEDALLVALVGRLCDVKGQRELIQSLADVPGAHAVLIGEDLEHGGDYRRLLEREADLATVRNRVSFTGARDDVGALLEQVDVLALPSWTEGLPLVVLEAMAHGRPVVATPVGGTSEAVVDGETGILVPPRDPASLAGALRRLADPALRERLGAAGRRRATERFSADEMARRMLEIYDEVTADGSEPSRR
jgi:glycosyltransferase involved in cell wall biosynthesis